LKAFLTSSSPSPDLERGIILKKVFTTQSSAAENPAPDEVARLLNASRSGWGVFMIFRFELMFIERVGASRFSAECDRRIRSVRAHC
jgi:hypothetical protein